MKKVLLVSLLLVGLTSLVIGWMRFIRPDTYNQSSQIDVLFARDSFFRKDKLDDLPLLEFPARSKANDSLVILFAGDGGWRGLVDVLAKRFAERGTPVVGFNTADYFNVTRTPQEIALTIERISRNFGHVWGRKHIILIGYSFSAEVLPFGYNAMSAEAQGYVSHIVMLAPSNWADFKSSPVYYYSPKTSQEVLPQLRRIPANKLLVVCDNIKTSLCHSMPGPTPYPLIRMDTDHNFNMQWTSLANMLMQHLQL